MTNVREGVSTKTLILYVAVLSLANGYPLKRVLIGSSENKCRHSEHYAKCSFPDYPRFSVKYHLLRRPKLKYPATGVLPSKRHPCLHREGQGRWPASKSYGFLYTELNDKTTWRQLFHLIRYFGYSKEQAPKGLWCGETDHNL